MKVSFKGAPVLEYTGGLISCDWDRRRISLSRLILRIDGGWPSCTCPVGGAPEPCALARCRRDKQYGLHRRMQESLQVIWITSHTVQRPELNRTCRSAAMQALFGAAERCAGGDVQAIHTDIATTAQLYLEGAVLRIVDDAMCRSQTQVKAAGQLFGCSDPIGAPGGPRRDGYPDAPFRSSAPQPSCLRALPTNRFLGLKGADPGNGLVVSSS